MVEIQYTTRSIPFLVREMSQEALRREIVETATEMLAGSISFIAGARRITAIGFRAGLDNDGDMIAFVGADSETDTLPIDPEIRKLWSPIALEQLQPEIDKAEAWAAEFLTPHCEQLIAKLTSD
jgi:hypothetical protein